MRRAAALTSGRVDLPAPPRQKVAIVACMDARLNPHEIFGLEAGDAHVIRNAGGSVTDDVIRSLAVSQRLLGTEEVILLHHRDCGMLSVDEEQFMVELREESGQTPEWQVGAFDDVETDVRLSIELVRQSPFLRRRHRVRGFVYDLSGGELHEVL